MATLILGYGVTGKAVERFLKRHDEPFIICDDRHDRFSIIDESLKQKPIRAVLSPGISTSSDIVQKVQEQNIPIISEIELGLSQTARQVVLGITGTNGKTTVTLLVEHVLKHQGYLAQAVGNVGTPFLDHVGDAKTKVLVTELSSYQIETTHSPFLDSAALLNISEDHLDRYPNYQAYAHQKARLGTLVKPKAPFIVNQKCIDAFPNEFKQMHHLSTFGWDERSDYFISNDSLSYKGLEYILPLRYRGMGSYEIENIVVAFALCKGLGVSWERFLEAEKTFQKPLHRMEYVATINDVKYYNDSKGTNIEAVMRGVESLDGSVILIAGGVDKKAPYTPWAQSFKGKVAHVLAMGQAADQIEKDLQAFIPVTKTENLEVAVKQAMQEAKPGMNVLLSPGCSSLDMFQNYEQRGNAFKSIVNQNLVGREKI